MTATTPTETAPTFAVGDWVIYQGSQWRYGGWAMKVTNYYDGGYSLCDEVWGVRLYRVRPSSVRADTLGD